LRAQRGFTLVEILVVVVIIAVMATLGMSSIVNRSLDDHLELEARLLQQLFRLAGEEAVMKGAELGFVQTPEGYEFLMLKDGHWIPLEEAGPLRARPLAEPFYLRLQVDGRAVLPVRTDDPKAELVPQVVLLSSGDATEFTLDLKAERYQPYYRLSGDVLGRVTLDRKGNS